MRRDLYAVPCGFSIFGPDNGLKGHLAVISSVASILPLGVCPAYSATKKFEAFYMDTLRQLAVIRNADISFTATNRGLWIQISSMAGISL